MRRENLRPLRKKPFPLLGRPLLALALLIAAQARAQQEPSPPPPPPETSPITRSFLEQFLSYDEESGQVVMGRQRRRLTPIEFFREVDRPDLVQRSEAVARRRVILGVAGGGLAVAGLTVAGVLLSNLPDLNGGYCVQSTQNYNGGRCVDNYQLRETLSAVSILVGLGVGSILATLAYWSNPAILSTDETVSLIARHNAGLRGQGNGAPGSSLRLQVTPYVALQGGGVLTTLTF